MLTKLTHIVLVSVFMHVSMEINGQNFTSQANPDESNGSLFEVLLTQPTVSPATFRKKPEILQFTHYLVRKKNRYKDVKDFWRFVYYKVHRKYLKRYKTPSTFEDVLTKGEYDCVSGTALYALIFDALGADYHIIETTYHIFLTLHVDEETILIESTKPLDGFVSDRMVINELQEAYNNSTDSGPWANRDYYRYQQPVNEIISVKQLAGLQYLNLAVQSYNSGDLQSAMILQDKALSLYPSRRSKELMAVMIDALEKDKTIDPFFRQRYLSKYNNLRNFIIVAQGANGR